MNPTTNQPDHNPTNSRRANMGASVRFRDEFWSGCVGTGWGFPVRVELESPLRNRELVDSACELDRYAHWRRY